MKRKANYLFTFSSPAANESRTS